MILFPTRDKSKREITDNVRFITKAMENLALKQFYLFFRYLKGIQLFDEYVGLYEPLLRCLGTLFTRYPYVPQTEKLWERYFSNLPLIGTKFFLHAIS